MPGPLTEIELSLASAIEYAEEALAMPKTGAPVLVKPDIGPERLVSRMSERKRGLVRAHDRLAAVARRKGELTEGQRALLVATLRRLLEEGFEIPVDDEEEENEHMINPGDTVLVRTTTDNIYRGKFVASTDQAVTITVDRSERHIPASHVEYIDKLPSIEDQLTENNPGA